MNLKYVLLSCLCICQLPLKAAFTPNEARRVYGESSISFGSSSSTEVGDYVFMEVKWSVDQGASAEDQELMELSAIMDAIQEYVSPCMVACTNSPFSKVLTTWLIPEMEFNVSEVQSSVVKNVDEAGKRCQVIAFDAHALKVEKDRIAKRARQVNERTKADWLAELKTAYVNFKTPAEKKKFNVMLGCPIVNFILCEGKYVPEMANEDERFGVLEVERIKNWNPGDGSVFSKYPNMLWRTYKNSESNIFFPAWRKNDGGKFAEAEVLYRKGTDVHRILMLLAESISYNPICEKKWSYLGGVLKALNKPEDAMIAYIQTLKFNKENPWAWKGVLECCKKLEMKSNADGLEWYLRLNGIK